MRSSFRFAVEGLYLRRLDREAPVDVDPAESGMLLQELKTFADNHVCHQIGIKIPLW